MWRGGCATYVRSVLCERVLCEGRVRVLCEERVCCVRGVLCEGRVAVGLG